MSLKYIGPASANKKKAVILLHGAGANRHDLAPLSNYLDPNKNFDWYFPEAPVNINPMFNMHVWFPVEEVISLLADPKTNPEDVANYLPQGIDEARLALSDFLNLILGSYESVIIGGFSQGSMMSADYFFHQASDKIKALLLFSGTSIDHSGWLKNMAAIKKIPIYQSHGREDSVLPFRFGEVLHQFLKQQAFPVEFHAFMGGHELPEEVLRSARHFLHKHLGDH